jgi:hypothetical protein
MTIDRDWQPIETAPKDGTKVLFWSSGTGDWPICGRWVDPDGADFSWWGMDKSALGNPTHWMPLPAPPSEGRPSQ